MLELEPMTPTMKNYRKYLLRQNTDDDDITMTKIMTHYGQCPKLFSKPLKQK